MPGAEFELREQDRWLPIANVSRLMKNTLPGTAKVSKDAKECMQECVSEFISFVTSEASDRCIMEKRKTINGEDVLYSMHTLGFENYAEVLKIYLAKYRQQQAIKQERGELRKKKKNVTVGNAGTGTGNGNSNSSGSGSGSGHDDVKGMMIANHMMASGIADNNSNVMNEHDSYDNKEREEFDYPMMDESMTLLHGPDGEMSKGIIHENAEMKNGTQVKKEDYDYVEQLYEQSYGAEGSISMSNPDYRGHGASVSIIQVQEKGLEIDDRDGSEVNTRIGVDVHVGNSRSLDVINSTVNHQTEVNGVHPDLMIGDKVGVHRLTEDVVTSRNGSVESIDGDGKGGDDGEEAGNANSNASKGHNGSVGDDEDDQEEQSVGVQKASANSSTSVSVSASTNTNTNTPATTSTSELLLLDDNLQAVTETEELVGLTNGHSVLF